MYILDLAKIGGNGNFSCPKCGAAISPDDFTEEAYSIIEARVNQQGLEEIIIRCIRCESFLHLTGFSLLQKLEIEKKFEHQKIEENACYIAHL